MEFSSRMRASMLIVIMFCVMCVSTVLTREEKIAAAEAEQEWDEELWEGRPGRGNDCTVKKIN